MPYLRGQGPFLYDDTSGDVVGLRDLDGSELYFGRQSVVWMEQFGSDGIEAALAALPATGGKIILPRGQVGFSHVVIDKPNVTIEGQGADGQFGTGPGGGGSAGATEVFIRSTTEPGFRVKKSAVTLRGFTLNSDTSRKAAALGTNYGIHVEAADTSGAATKRFKAEGVRVTNQPSHGIVMVNDIVCSRLDFFDVDNTFGHGIVVVGGTFTGRTFMTRPGQLDVWNCRVSRTGGHSILVGVLDEDTTNDVPYRVNVRNLEGFYNGLTPGLLLATCNAYISGENHTWSDAGLDGQTIDGSSVVTDAHVPIRVRGQNISLLNQRFINGNPYAGYVEDHPLIQTRDIRIAQPYVVNTLQGAGFYDPAFHVEAGCQGVRIEMDDKPSGIASLANTGSTRYFFLNEGKVKTDIKHETKQVGMSGFVSRETPQTIADDAAAYIEFSGVAQGFLMIGGSALARGGVIGLFRVGDGSAHFTPIPAAGVGATFAFSASATPLTGTTGVDGQVTVRAMTNTNRIYIENRSGVAGNYGWTLFLYTAGVTASEMVAA